MAGERRRGGRPLAQRIIVWLGTLVVVLALMLKTPLGLKAASQASTHGGSSGAVCLLRAMQRANYGMQLGLQAHRLEVVVLQVDVVMGRRPWPAVTAAAERYASAAIRAGDEREVLFATHMAARTHTFLGQYDLAVTRLDRALTRHRSEPWTGRYCVERMRWLVDGGRYEEAVRDMDAFAKYHADSDWAEPAVVAAWSAYQRAGRRADGVAALWALTKAHSGTRLAVAVQTVLGGEPSQAAPATRDAPPRGG
jgi:hypothetical protein